MLTYWSASPPCCWPRKDAVHCNESYFRRTTYSTCPLFAARKHEHQVNRNCPSAALRYCDPTTPASYTKVTLSAEIHPYTQDLLIDHVRSGCTYIYRMNDLSDDGKRPYHTTIISFPVQYNPLKFHIRNPPFISHTTSRKDRDLRNERAVLQWQLEN